MMLRRPAQTLPYTTPPIGEIYPIRKTASWHQFGVTSHRDGVSSVGPYIYNVILIYSFPFPSSLLNGGSFGVGMNKIALISITSQFLKGIHFEIVTHKCKYARCLWPSLYMDMKGSNQLASLHSLITRQFCILVWTKFMSRNDLRNQVFKKFDLISWFVTWDQKEGGIYLSPWNHDRWLSPQRTKKAEYVFSF